MSEPHTPDLRYSRSYDEWVSGCTCGWVGSYCETFEGAEREFVFHESEAIRR
jgi:hypothetical protein